MHQKAAPIYLPFWGNLAPNEVFPKARENALKALELDSANGLDIPEYTDPRTGDSDPPQKVLVL
jgi:hypothetical protein